MLKSIKMTNTMSDETFAELMQSIKEGAKILHGKLPPASEFVHTHTDNNKTKKIKQFILSII